MSRTRVIAAAVVVAVVAAALGLWLQSQRPAAEPEPSVEVAVPGDLGIPVAVDPRADGGTWVPVQRFAVTEDGSTVLAAVEADQCHGLVDATADERTSPDTVTVAVAVGPLPELGDGCEPVPATWEVAVPLSEPLGERRLVDTSG
jgi:hypothetical protein